MQPNEVIALVKKAVQESNKNFHLSYLDGNGFPHTSLMGFAHLNKNLSVVMLLKSSARKVETLREQPWIELVFHTRDYRGIVKCFGKALVTNSPGTTVKLVQAYPFLAEYFEADGSDAVVVQLQTQLIELETLAPGARWHAVASYQIQDGVPVETDKPVLQGAAVVAPEQSDEQFDAVRRLITRNHGEILMEIIHQNWDEIMPYVSPDFSDGSVQGREGYRDKIAARFRDVELANAEINWGLRNFTARKDGSVECQFFLDILVPGGTRIAVKQRESWVPVPDNMLLFSEEST